MMSTIIFLDILNYESMHNIAMVLALLLLVPMMVATLVFCGLSCFTHVKEDRFHHSCSIETTGIIFVRVLWNHSRLTLGLIYFVFL